MVDKPMKYRVDAIMRDGSFKSYECTTLAVVEPLTSVMRSDVAPFDMAAAGYTVTDIKTNATRTEWYR